MALPADAIPVRGFARRDPHVEVRLRATSWVERLRARLLRFNWQPLHLPLSIMGLLALGAIWLMPSQGYDAYAYWAVDPLSPYESRTDFGAFLYAPPMALLMAPLGMLPFEIAYLAWLGLSLAALWFVAGRWALAAVLFPPVFVDLAFGNIHILFAAMIVAAWRWPGAWAFAFLTKITPAVGIVWHAVRGEWRSVGAISAVVAAAVGVSLVIQGPAVWVSWIEMLDARQAHVSPTAVAIPLVPRFIAAIALVIWGARSGHRWTVPVALCLAVPVWYWSGLMLAPLVAIAALRARQLEAQSPAADETRPSTDARPLGASVAA